MGSSRSILLVKLLQEEPAPAEQADGDTLVLIDELGGGTDPDEGAALGAAMNALTLHQGLADDPQGAAQLIDEHISFDGEITAEPDPGKAVIYQESYQRYQEYVALVKPMFE